MKHSARSIIQICKAEEDALFAITAEYLVDTNRRRALNVIGSWHGCAINNASTLDVFLSKRRHCCISVGEVRRFVFFTP